MVLVWQLGGRLSYNAENLPCWAPVLAVSDGKWFIVLVLVPSCAMRLPPSSCYFMFFLSLFFLATCLSCAVELFGSMGV